MHNAHRRRTKCKYRPFEFGLSLLTLVVTQLLGCNVGTAQTVVQEVQVVDDRSQPIVSLIRLVGVDGNIIQSIDNTDSHGILRSVFKCPTHDRVQAAPVSGPYRNSPAQTCSRIMKIVVWSPQIVEALSDEAASAAAAGRYGVAALLYNEVYQRTTETDGGKSTAAQVAAINNAGKALKVPVPANVDPAQSKVVPSPDMVRALKQYQARRGLEANGKIDFETLSSLAGGKPVAPFISKAANHD